MNLKVPPDTASGEPIVRAAALLTVGDTIAKDFVPEREPAEVHFLHRYERLAGEPWVFVVYFLPGGQPGSTYFQAGALVGLDALDYADLADRLAGGDKPVPADADVIALGHAAETSVE